MELILITLFAIYSSRCEEMKGTVSNEKQLIEERHYPATLLACGKDTDQTLKSQYKFNVESNEDDISAERARQVLARVSTKRIIEEMGDQLSKLQEYLLSENSQGEEIRAYEPLITVWNLTDLTIKCCLWLDQGMREVPSPNNKMEVHLYELPPSNFYAKNFTMPPPPNNIEGLVQEAWKLIGDAFVNGLKVDNSAIYMLFYTFWDKMKPRKDEILLRSVGGLPPNLEAASNETTTEIVSSQHLIDMGIPGPVNMDSNGSSDGVTASYTITHSEIESGTDLEAEMDQKPEILATQGSTVSVENLPDLELSGDQDTEDEGTDNPFEKRKDLSCSSCKTLWRHIPSLELEEKDLHGACASSSDNKKCEDNLDMVQRSLAANLLKEEVGWFSKFNLCSELCGENGLEENVQQTSPLDTCASCEERLNKSLSQFQNQSAYEMFYMNLKKEWMCMWMDDFEEREWCLLAVDSLMPRAFPEFIKLADSPRGNQLIEESCSKIKECASEVNEDDSCSGCPDLTDRVDISMFELNVSNICLELRTNSTEILEEQCDREMNRFWRIMKEILFSSDQGLFSPSSMCNDICSQEQLDYLHINCNDCQKSITKTMEILPQAEFQRHMVYRLRNDMCPQMNIDKTICEEIAESIFPKFAQKLISSDSIWIERTCSLSFHCLPV